MLTLCRSLQRRKTNNQPRDASTPHGSTVAESVRNLIKKNPKYSKKINYNALKDLFTDEGSSFQMPDLSDDKDDDGHLYTMDDKDDEAGMLIVEEEGGGGVGQVRATKSRSASLVPAVAPAAVKSAALDDIPEGDEEDAEGEDDIEEDAEKDDAYGEWDVYEQEV